METFLNSLSDSFGCLDVFLQSEFQKLNIFRGARAYLIFSERFSVSIFCSLCSLSHILSQYTQLMSLIECFQVAALTWTSVKWHQLVYWERIWDKEHKLQKMLNWEPLLRIWDMLLAPLKIFSFWNSDCRKTSRPAKAVRQRIQKCFHHYCLKCSERQN